MENLGYYYLIVNLDRFSDQMLAFPNKMECFEAALFYFSVSGTNVNKLLKELLIRQL